jgi:hypothetical protein
MLADNGLDATTRLWTAKYGNDWASQSRDPKRPDRRPSIETDFKS